MKDYVLEENSKRASEYKKEESVENYLRFINKELSEIEAYQNGLEELPLIFIFGLPRSGTTLTYQLVANGMDLGYINNLMARFWLAPQTGIMLSKSILKEKKDFSFQSDYGKSVTIEGVHEFAYFWQHWLHMNKIDDMLDFSGFKTNIDEKELRKIILNMQHTFGKGMVFKTNYVANLLNQFAAIFKNALFIYVKRDINDVARSILKARKDYFNDIAEWWATYCPSYNEISSSSYDIQIARQVVELEKVYDHKIQELSKERYIIIDYDKLCSNPQKFLYEVQTKVKINTGYEIPVHENIPESFPFRKQSSTISEEEQNLLEAIKKERECIR
jgi:hypothetical protein